MNLKIYNSLTNQKELFVPIKPNMVSMYVCGPTVNKRPHIGNAWPPLFFDMVKRYLEYRGYQVIYAHNITDVDDKIIKQALEENITEKEVATLNEAIYLSNIQALNCELPDKLPHATEYIDAMIDLISQLIEKGYAYLSGEDVYFRVNKVANYGIVSNQVLADLKNSIRIDDNDKKENPLDFTLWKKTDVGINWDSPFGRGRPGWHTECVAMIRDIFGGKIDIHGGGNDLKFPHHENECAQHHALSGDVLANYFMHVGRLDLAGQKMSKSLGNVKYISDFTDGPKADAFRLLILMHYYRTTFEFSDAMFEEYETTIDKIKKALISGQTILDLNDIPLSTPNQADIDEFNKWMEDDFNTPNVLTLILRIVKDINIAIRGKDYFKAALAIQTLLEITNVLGFNFPYTKQTAETKTEYANWIKAREDKDFALADSLRQKLVAKGVL